MVANVGCSRNDYSLTMVIYSIANDVTLQIGLDCKRIGVDRKLSRERGILREHNGAWVVGIAIGPLGEVVTDIRCCCNGSTF